MKSIQFSGTHRKLGANSKIRRIKDGRAEKCISVKKIGGWLVENGIEVGKSISTELLKAWLLPGS